MSGITSAEGATEPPTARPRNPRGEGDRLRAEILAAAAELLEADGDERAVTLRAVARRAGIAAPSIYPHFHDRPALMLQVMWQAFTGLSVRVRSALDQAGDDPQERLHAACRAYLDFARDHPERYRVMFGGEWTPHPARTTRTMRTTRTEGFTRSLTDGFIGCLTDCLADCLAAGRGTGIDPAADAVALWLGLHGLAHQRAIAPAFPWPADIVQRVAFPLSHLA
ncbi:TetR/AcrR family transcriptional regulator [Streptomyces sp. LRE541]|uniref:TetR/AcrR family transcriptional regulator n=1 Tax=Streptomyces sp. LRE541 TaxID=2931983 RepID=UPI00200F1100|nr:TetR/AcrR family transcriptional regulator [Streptomyces sp. LRE541]UPZ29699.1 TetR/AcrR family transcriptional regulator [Streptomyces sp. LRE541]